MAGYLCVYEDGGTNRARIGFESLEDFQGDNGADANGFHVVFRATAASGLPGSFSFGSWAATAP
jgi:hypothetical protein